MERLNVMVVDDSTLVAKILASSLTQLGHKVVATAHTGAAALLAYRTCNPDLVLMDVTMPDMDGITATEKIVKMHPEARVIIVTSHAEESVIASALKAGAKGYLRKPFQIDKLRATLDDVIKANPPVQAS